MGVGPVTLRAYLPSDRGNRKFQTSTELDMPAAKVRACTILAELSQAQVELVGKAVILTNGTAGTVESVLLDEFHGLRISVKGHEGQWPVSTIKKAQTT